MPAAPAYFLSRIPALRITSPRRLLSALMTAANSAGVLATTSTPELKNRSFISGACSTRVDSACRRILDRRHASDRAQDDAQESPAQVEHRSQQPRASPGEWGGDAAVGRAHARCLRNIWPRKKFNNFD